jgi:SAM-dependent methyltransferase
MISVDFYTPDWLQSHREQSKGFLKRFIYFFSRPILSLKYSRYLSKNTLDRYRPKYCLGSRGTPLEYRRAWASHRLKDLREATILIQGTGTGWDVISWARLKPRKIVAVDLFSFDDSWREIAQYCREHYHVKVDFAASPLEDLAGIPANSIDLISSDAVYEHCRNLPAVMQESYRILRPGGFLYASYRPYYCDTGDHFSGRGGLETIYNHVWLDQDAYKTYINENQRQVEELQSGVRFINMDLFSYLTTAEYFDIYKQANFITLEVIFEISQQGLKFKRCFSDKFKSIVEKNREKFTEDDLIIKTHLILLQKPEIITS